MLDCREKAILTTVTEIERKDLDPLNNLEDKINRELDKTVKLLEKGKRLLSIIIYWFLFSEFPTQGLLFTKKKTTTAVPFLLYTL